MPIHLYNTLTRRKEPFQPLDPKRVRLYVCGPTVYDFAHIGNARPVVVFDTLFRLLRHAYGVDHVTYVRNITDVDDKIIAAAAESGEAIRALTERTAAAYREDMAALNSLPPTHEPRATEHISQMIAMTERLIAGGFAYAAEGHALFHVPAMADYGQLSRRSLDDMIAGARVEVAPYKKHPADFVLWKPSTPEQPGWDSPWGRGRPGWHIECSAMAEGLLGETFDIHGGGQDLIFPHHENEIAQSRCAHGGAPLARVWMHNGFVQVEGEKMSKSLGNFFTVRQLLEEGHRGEVIRLALLSAHYRQPLDFTRARLKEAKSRLDGWYRVLLDLKDVQSLTHGMPNSRVISALEDDLNLHLALYELNNHAYAVRQVADRGNREAKAEAKANLIESGRLLGLLQEDPEEWFQQTIRPSSILVNPQFGTPTVTQVLSKEQIEEKIAARAAARKAKNFAEADRIRDELGGEGIVLEDGPSGTTWRRAG